MGSGFTTFTAGNVLTASEVNNYLMEQSVMSFATAAARASAVTAPETGMMYWDQALLTLNVYNGTSWLCTTPQVATIATVETTASTSYVALATAGPSVSILTGTKALVTVGARFDNTGVGIDIMSYAVSGATTLAANDARAAIQINPVGGPGFAYNQCSFTHLVTGLTAGTNVFTAQYRTVSGTGQYANRNISVEALP
jgi:hypothetical protein